MQIEAFVLCDAATQSGGKLNILGAFDTIGAHQVPTNHPHCTVALRIRFSRVETGDHRIRLNIIDQDGNLVVPSIEGNVSISIPDNHDSIAANVILNIQGLHLKQFGKFAIDLAIDGRQEATIPLIIREVSAPTPKNPN